MTEVRHCTTALTLALGKALSMDLRHDFSSSPDKLKMLTHIRYLVKYLCHKGAVRELEEGHLSDIHDILNEYGIGHKYEPHLDIASLRGQLLIGLHKLGKSWGGVFLLRDMVAKIMHVPLIRILDSMARGEVLYRYGVTYMPSMESMDSESPESFYISVAVSDLRHFIAVEKALTYSVYSFFIDRVVSHLEGCGAIVVDLWQFPDVESFCAYRCWLDAPEKPMEVLYKELAEGAWYAGTGAVSIGKG